MMRQNEDGRMIRRRIATPDSPVLVPVTTVRAEHVAAHYVCATGLQQLVAHPHIPFMARVIGMEMPLVKSEASHADRILSALRGPATNPSIEMDI